MHDYLLALTGGAMIGLAAVLLMLTSGNIMGTSGMVSRLLPPVASGWAWRLAFLAGVVAAPLALTRITGSAPLVEITANTPLLVIGGLLVGIGTVLGNGCTSGHGVCGMSRFSGRSLLATATFMLSAIVTVFIVNQLSAA